MTTEQMREKVKAALESCEAWTATDVDGDRYTRYRFDRQKVSDALAALAASPAPQTVDTPELWRALWDWRNVANEAYQADAKKRLIAELDRIVTARTAAPQLEAAQPAPVPVAQERFADYFTKNYPADTIIGDPAWHAPRIFNAALFAMRDAAPAQQEQAPQPKYDQLRAAFHATMLRLMPEKSHAEISAEIDRVAGEAPQPVSAPVAPDEELTMLRATRYDETHGITATLRNDRIAELEAQLGQAPVSQDIASLKEQNAELVKDAERLNFLDRNEKYRMGWKVKAAPVGNLSVQSIIMGGTSIRAAIDAAIASAHQENNQ